MTDPKPLPVRDDAARIKTLERAVLRHTREKSPLKAIAACKRILLIDPDHAGTKERIAELCAELHGEETPVHERPRVDLERGAPLDELVLEDVMKETPELELDDDANTDPMIEIELDWKETAGDDARRWARDVLPRAPLFASLDAKSLQRLVEGARLVELAAGHELFHQGDPGDSLFIVAEGAVVPVAEGEVRKKLAVLEEGDFFGEISLVTERPRSASIEALVDTKLLAVDRRLLSELMEADPRVLDGVLGCVRDRLIDRLVRTSSFFAALPRNKREGVARRFRFVEMKDGSMIVRQGKPSPGFFALLAGRVDVIHSDSVGDRRLATLSPGDVFGEMSMLTSEPAVASCMAEGKCWALVLPRKDFLRLSQEEPAVAEAAAEIAEARRRSNETSLMDTPYLDGQLDLL